MFPLVMLQVLFAACLASRSTRGEKDKGTNPSGFGMAQVTVLIIYGNAFYGAN